MDVLINNTEIETEVARKKIEASFLRYRSKWQRDNGFNDRLINTKTKKFVDISKMTDANIVDSDLAMLGEKGGVLNTVDGYTTSWAGELVVRPSDSKKQIPLPDDATLRAVILVGVVGEIVEKEKPIE